MTGNKSLPFFAESLGWLRGTVDRYLRDLRERGHLRTGRRGGGRGTVHYDANDFAIVVLGFGATQPSDASEALEKLRDLRLIEHSEIQRTPGSGRQAELTGQAADYRGLQGERLLGSITRQLVEMEDPDVAAQWSAEVGTTWRMVLCMDPPSALVTWVDPDGTTITDTYGPPQTNLPYATNGTPPRARRLVELPFSVLVTAARLAADTAARQRTAALQRARMVSRYAAQGPPSQPPAPSPRRATRIRSDDRMMVSSGGRRLLRPAEGLAGTPDAVHDHREFPRKRDPCLAST